MMTLRTAIMPLSVTNGAPHHPDVNVALNLHVLLRYNTEWTITVTLLCIACKACYFPCAMNNFTSEVSYKGNWFHNSIPHKIANQYVYYCYFSESAALVSTRPSFESFCLFETSLCSV